MLEAAKSRTKMTKMMLKVDTLKGLMDRKVGTNSIEKAAKLVIEEPIRNETVVVKLVQIALEGAAKKLSKKKKFANYKVGQTEETEEKSYCRKVQTKI